jgi:hypothetical protein
MALFDANPADAAGGYRNIRAAADSSDAGAIRKGLEELWMRYEPYADTGFCNEFARHPDERFWEMYLAVCMLRARRNLRRRGDLTLAQRDTGPDICIRKGRRRRIWIEAEAPGPGDADNPDQVPDFFAATADEELNAPRRQIELRITGSLRRKAEKFESYYKRRIIGETDSCIVAISACRFSLEAAGAGMPHAVTAVYPFGDEFAILDPETAEVSCFGHTYSAEIKRARGAAVARTAFQHKNFCRISGLIWSRRSIGNFLGQADDLVFVHNQMATRPISRRWIDWAEEYFPVEDGKKLIRKCQRT